jgi:hypothetical protein
MMGDKIVDGLGAEMSPVKTTTDLERGRSRDLVLLTRDGETFGEGEEIDTRMSSVSRSKLEPRRSVRHKYLLLSVFCLGVFIDGKSGSWQALRCVADDAVLGVCVFYLLIAPVAKDLDIVFEQQTWVIVSRTSSTRRTKLTSTDLIYSHIRFFPPILGPIFRLVLSQTCILLRLPRPRDPQPRHLVSHR